VRGNKPTDPVAEMMQSTSYSTALNTSPVSVTCSTPLNSEVSNHGRDKSTFFDTTQAGDTVTRDTDADSEPVTKAMGAAGSRKCPTTRCKPAIPRCTRWLRGSTGRCGAVRLAAATVAVRVGRRRPYGTIVWAAKP
jgi:hypothetical protein